MKHILVTFIAAFVINITQHANAQTTTSPEQLAFHSVMSSAYQAWKSNNSVDMARQNSDAIYTAAVEWKSSEAGKSLAKPAKKSLKQLVKLSKQLKKLAAKTDNDEAVKQKIAHINKVYNDLVAVAGGPASS
jgi:hypothetical protein